MSCKHEHVFFEFDDYDLINFMCVECGEDLEISSIKNGEFKTVRINETFYISDPIQDM